MSMKIPSITTPLANDALQATHNTNILIGDNASSLAANILNLLNDSQLYNKISENGFAFVKNKYSWEEATDKLHFIMYGAHHQNEK